MCVFDKKRSVQSLNKIRCSHFRSFWTWALVKITANKNGMKNANETKIITSICNRVKFAYLIGRFVCLHTYSVSHTLRERLKLLSAPAYSHPHLCTLANECYSLETLPLCLIDLHKQPAATFSCSSTLAFFCRSLFIIFRFTSFHPLCSLAKCHKLNDRFSLWPPCDVQCACACVCVYLKLVPDVRSGATRDICKMVCLHVWMVKSPIRRENYSWKWALRRCHRHRFHCARNILFNVCFHANEVQN